MQEELKIEKLLVEKELESTQLKITKLESRIKYDIQHNVKPKSNDIPTLEARRDELEFKRSTSTLSLNDEKKLLKDINFITKEIKEITEFNTNRTSISLLKDELSNLFSKSHELKAKSFSLQHDITKWNLASKLNCNSLSQMIKKEIVITSASLGKLIGRKGHTVAQLQKDFFVDIQVPNNASALGNETTVILTGSSDNIEKASVRIEELLYEETLELNLLQRKWLRFHKRNFDLEPYFRFKDEGVVVVLTNVTSNKAAEVRALLDLHTSNTDKIPVLTDYDTTSIKRRFFQWMKETHTFIEEESCEISIIGSTENINRVKNLVNTFIDENTMRLIDTGKDDPVFFHHILSSLKKRGIYFKTDGSNCISYKSQEIDFQSEFNSHVTFMRGIKDFQVPILIGKKGATITSLESSHNVKIQVLKDNDIRIYSKDNEATSSHEAAQEAIKKLFEDNHREILSSIETRVLNLVAKEKFKGTFIKWKENCVVITGNIKDAEETKQAVLNLSAENTETNLLSYFTPLQVHAISRYYRIKSDENSPSVRRFSDKLVGDKESTGAEIDRMKQWLTHSIYIVPNINLPWNFVTELKKTFSVFFDAKESSLVLLLETDKTSLEDFKAMLTNKFVTRTMRLTSDTVIPKEVVDYATLCFATEIKIRRQNNSITMYGPVGRVSNAMDFIKSYLKDDTIKLDLGYLNDFYKLFNGKHWNENISKSSIVTYDSQKIVLVGSSLSEVLRVKDSIESIVQHYLSDDIVKVFAVDALIDFSTMMLPYSYDNCVLSYHHTNEGGNRLRVFSHDANVIALIQKDIRKYQEENCSVKLPSSGGNGGYNRSIRWLDEKKLKVDCGLRRVSVRYNNDPITVSLQGPVDSIEKAKTCIANMIAEQKERQMQLETSRDVALIIGKKGATIKALQEKFNVVLNVNGMVLDIIVNEKEGANDVVKEVKEAVAKIIAPSSAREDYYNNNMVKSGAAADSHNAAHAAEPEEEAEH